MINALIYAAGLGSRLKPLTDHRPKALVRVAGIPLLEIALRKMEHLGIPKVVVNVHHYADQIIDFVNSFKSSSMEILISDERDQLMDTGGGFLKAHHLFNPQWPTLLYNADILTNADLKPFIEAHIRGHQPVTLMVKRREASRYLLFDQQMNLSGWRQADGSRETIIHPEGTLTPFGFQGIHMAETSIFKETTTSGPFPIIPFYLNLAKANAVVGYETPNDTWFDIGTPQKLVKAETFIKGCTPAEQTLLLS